MARMKRALSARSIGWLGFTVLLVMLGLGLFFQQPPDGVGDAPSGAPSFDLQALLPDEPRGAAEMEQAAREALEQGATTLVVPVAASGDALFAGAGGPELGSFIETLEGLEPDAPRYAFRVPVSPETPGEAVDALADALTAIIRAKGIEARAIVQAFDWRMLKAVHAAMPEVARGYMTREESGRDTVGRGEDKPSPWLAGLDVNRFDASIPRTIRAAESGRAAETGESEAPEEAAALVPWQVIWTPFYQDLRAPAIAEAHAIGLKVVPWPVDDGAVMRALIEDGVDGLATARPDAARAVLDAME
jgi:glycerophosphoryl diester phosphodiesterase